MAVGAFASGDLRQDPRSQSETYLRVVHASPDAPAVDVYLDNESIVTNASFGDVTDYMTLEPGTHTLTITEAGDREAVVFSEEVTLDPRTPMTLAASGEMATAATSTFDVRAFTDNPFEPGENASAVRVVHLSPDAPTVDVTANNGSVVLAENVSFANASDYVSVPAGDYTVEIREATDGDEGTLISTANVSLASGQAASVWAMGFVVPMEDQEPFTASVTEDATVSVTLPPTATPTANETETATGTATGTPTGTETETPTGTETETPTGTETETPTGTETETPTGTETETPTGTATETPTPTPTP